MPGRNKLTDRQQQVLDFIQAKIHRDGYPPTIREIGDQLGIRSTNGVNDHLKALSKKGYLQRTEAKSRACVPTNGRDHFRSDVIPVEELDDMIDVPVLGKIAAGQPILALEHQEDSVRIDRAFLGKNRDVFGLRVVGESMIEDGIHDGDFIFVKKQRTAAAARSWSLSSTTRRPSSATTPRVTVSGFSPRTARCSRSTCSPATSARRRFWASW